MLRRTLCPLVKWTATIKDVSFGMKQTFLFPNNKTLPLTFHCVNPGTNELVS
jgi:hypothetical protein